MGNRETSCASRSGREASGNDDGNDILGFCSDMTGAIFRKPTRQDPPLFSAPPSVQADAPSQEAQAKDRWRGARHDDGPMQPQRMRGAQFVTPAQRRERQANA